MVGNIIAGCVGSVYKYLHSSGSKSLLSTLGDALAFILQTTGIIASTFFKHKERSGNFYILPVSLVLSSFRWWPNYISDSDEEPSKVFILLYILLFHNFILLSWIL